MTRQQGQHPLALVFCLCSIIKVCTSLVPRRLKPNKIRGTVLYELYDCKVIRNGDKVTKIHALDGIKESEAEVMRFVREHTTILVLRVHATTPISITMDYIEGTTLNKAWNRLSDAERAEISN